MESTEGINRKTLKGTKPFITGIEGPINAQMHGPAFFPEADINRRPRPGVDPVKTRTVFADQLRFEQERRFVGLANLDFNAPDLIDEPPCFARVTIGVDVAVAVEPVAEGLGLANIQEDFVGIVKKIDAGISGQSAKKGRADCVMQRFGWRKKPKLLGAADRNKHRPEKDGSPRGR